MSSIRRSQAERSAATREALLDATIDCLIEEGYDSTTTSRVSERAGLSRGAHLHHFQTQHVPYRFVQVKGHVAVVTLFPQPQGNTVHHAKVYAFDLADRKPLWTLDLFGANPNPAYQALSETAGTAVNLLTYSAPTAGADPVTLGFRQAIGATDVLRAGTYSKTLTFSLSTTTP